jgi:ELWxxDGT repeat protein
LAQVVNPISIELKQNSQFMNSFFQRLWHHLAATFVSCCFLGSAVGADLQKLTDIAPSGGNVAGSDPSNFIKIGNALFFAATSATYGRELWKTDGTTAGTVLVKDIVPGTYQYNNSTINNSSNPESLTAVGSTLYFTARDASSGRELWKSDGTAAGTVMVKDIFPGTSSSFLNSSTYQNLTAVGNTLYFTARGENTDYSLWKSDGTETGTVLVKSISTSNFTAVGDTLYFTASDSINGKELWKSDGTDAGTVLVKDIYPGPGPSTSNDTGSPDYFTALGSTLYFTASEGINGRELWKSDGTAAGTVLVKNIYPGSGSSLNNNAVYPRYLTAVGSTLYFSADDGSNGQELWKSDGTASGTVLVKDIYPGPNTGISPYNSQSFTAFGDILYFTAQDGINGLELWKSDGTAAGTVLVKDINPGTNSSGAQSMTILGSNLYFSASNESNGNELWKSDGTTEGTVLVKDIVPGPGWSSIQNLAVAGNTLCFTAYNASNGRELWRSDGTTEGTVLVKDIYPGNNSRYPQNLTAVGGNLYFTAEDYNGGFEIWKSNGTTAGTVLVYYFNRNNNYGSNLSLTAVGSTLFFRADNGNNGNELWKSDGTAAGTVLVKDIYPDDYSGSPGSLTTVGSTLYFSADNGNNGNELWKSDGTAAGTVMVKDIYPGANSSNPSALAVVGSTLYFRAYDSGNDSELWKSDGTAAGTVLVKDINPGTSGSSPSNLTVVGNTLYFLAYDASNGYEVWKSDGTSAGTVLVKDIYPGINSIFDYSSNHRNLTAVGSNLYFTASDGINGRELWKSNGTATGTVIVKDISPGGTSSDPQYLTAVGSNLYFTAVDGSNRRELWKSDGTAAGTVLVKDIFLGTNSSDPKNLTAVGSTLYFIAADPCSGRELWKSDGTAAGTVLVQDIAEGTGESSPSDLTLIGSNLYFVATTEISGRQLFVFNTVSANLPTVQIAPVSSLAATSATFQGTVVSDGGSVITTRGMVYAPTSLNADPQIGGIGVVQISSPGSLGTFSVSSTNLSPGTSYNFRAYATNANGTACSSLGTFSTLTTLNQAESWRNNAFGSPQNFGIAADLADPDKDGISNLLERAFNLSPVQAGMPILVPGVGTAGLPRVQTITGLGGVTGLSVQYIRLKASTNPGIIYLPEFSSNLGAFWSAASGLESVESIDSNWERVTIQDNSTGQRARFGRVKVSTTPE